MFLNITTSIKMKYFLRFQRCRFCGKRVYLVSLPFAPCFDLRFLYRVVDKEGTYRTKLSMCRLSGRKDGRVDSGGYRLDVYRRLFCTHKMRSTTIPYEKDKLSANLFLSLDEYSVVVIFRRMKIMQTRLFFHWKDVVPAMLVFACYPLYGCK